MKRFISWDGIEIAYQEWGEATVLPPTGPEAAAFRALADAMHADREALIAQARSVYRGVIALDQISAPTLILAGARVDRMPPH